MSAAIVTLVTENFVNILTKLNLSFTAGTTSTPFVIERRKTPAIPQNPNPLESNSLNLPQLVVSVGTEDKYQDITASTRLCSYPCAVTIVTTQGNQLAFDDQLASLVDTLKYQLTLHSNWYGIPNLPFNQIDAYGRTPFDIAALKANLDYRILTFTVQTLEPRN